MSGPYDKVKFLGVPYYPVEIDMKNLEKYELVYDISNYLYGKITCISKGNDKEILLLTEYEQYNYGNIPRNNNMVIFGKTLNPSEVKPLRKKNLAIFIKNLGNNTKSDAIFIPPDTPIQTSTPTFIKCNMIERFIIDNFNGKITQKNDVWCPGTFITEDRSMSENLNFNRLATEIMVNGFGYPEDTKIYGPLIFGNNTRFIRKGNKG